MMLEASLLQENSTFLVVYLICFCFILFFKYFVGTSWLNHLIQSLQEATLISIFHLFSPNGIQASSWQRFQIFKQFMSVSLRIMDLCHCFRQLRLHNSWFYTGSYKDSFPQWLFILLFIFYNYSKSQSITVTYIQILMSYCGNYFNRMNQPSICPALSEQVST